MNLKDMQNELLDTVDLMIEERFKEYSNFNYYIEAKVIAVNNDNTCDIEFNGQVLNSVKTRRELILAQGDIVLVCVVNGNFSNKFIDLIRP